MAGIEESMQRDDASAHPARSRLDSCARWTVSTASTARAHPRRTPTSTTDLEDAVATRRYEQQRRPQSEPPRE